MATRLATSGGHQAATARRREAEALKVRKPLDSFPPQFVGVLICGDMPVEVHRHSDRAMTKTHSHSTLVYCFAKIDQRERAGGEGRLTHLWLIVLVLLFMLYG
jgi:hypothetical protein